MDRADAAAYVEETLAGDETGSTTWRSLTEQDRSDLLDWAVKAWTDHGDQGRLAEMVQALKNGSESFDGWRAPPRIPPALPNLTQ
jgi:hypothetical protein